MSTPPKAKGPDSSSPKSYAAKVASKGSFLARASSTGDIARKAAARRAVPKSGSKRIEEKVLLNWAKYRGAQSEEWKGLHVSGLDDIWRIPTFIVLVEGALKVRIPGLSGGKNEDADAKAIVRFFETLKVSLECSAKDFENALLEKDHEKLLILLWHLVEVCEFSKLNLSIGKGQLNATLTDLGQEYAQDMHIERFRLSEFSTILVEVAKQINRSWVPGSSDSDEFVLTMALSIVQGAIPELLSVDDIPFLDLKSFVLFMAMILAEVRSGTVVTIEPEAATPPIARRKRGSTLGSHSRPDSPLTVGEVTPSPSPAPPLELPAAEKVAVLEHLLQVRTRELAEANGKLVDLRKEVTEVAARRAEVDFERHVRTVALEQTRRVADQELSEARVRIEKLDTKRLELEKDLDQALDEASGYVQKIQALKVSSRRGSVSDASEKKQADSEASAIPIAAEDQRALVAQLQQELGQVNEELRVSKGHIDDLMSRTTSDKKEDVPIDGPRPALSDCVRVALGDHVKLLNQMRLLQDAVTSREWNLVSQSANHGGVHLNRDQVEKLEASAAKAEEAVIASRRDEQQKRARGDARRDLLSFLKKERSLVQGVLVPLLAEMDQLASAMSAVPKAGPIGSATGGSDAAALALSVLPDEINSLRSQVFAQSMLAKRIRQLQLRLADAEVEWVRVKWIRDAAQEQKVFQDLATELQDQVQGLVSTSLVGKVAQLHKAMGGFMQGRLDALSAMRWEILEYADEIERRHAELERIVDAQPRADSLEQEMDAAVRALEDSKDELSYLQQAFKRKKVSETDVQNGEQVVATNRARVQDVIREILEVRQMGYPELECPAAEKSDRYSIVPQIFVSQLDVGREIGSGTYSDVVEAVIPWTGRCAFKRLRNNDMPIDTLVKEARAMWELRHEPHVVRLLKVCVVDEKAPADQPKRGGLLLELMEGGSLGELLHNRKEKLSRDHALKLLRHVALGLAAVHERGYQHLDLKSYNVLLTSDRQCAKLSDFGTVRATDMTGRATSLKVSTRWSAPELLLPASVMELPVITAGADIWAFGMLVYEVFCGRLPFDEFMNEPAVVAAILRGELPALGSEVDPALASLIRECWSSDHAQRPAAGELIRRISSLMHRTCSRCAVLRLCSEGILSTPLEHSFLCQDCIPHLFQQMRSDGSLPCDGNNEESYVLDRSMEHDRDLCEKWLASRVESRERELTTKFLSQLKREVEEKRRAWEAEDQVKRLAQTLIREVLGPTAEAFACPGCRAHMEYTTGCMVFHHEACGTRWCGFCFGVFTHEGLYEHAQQCGHNPYKGNYDLPPGVDKRATFAAIQNRRKLGELRMRFTKLSQELHQPLFIALRERLAEIGVSTLSMLVELK